MNYSKEEIINILSEENLDNIDKLHKDAYRAKLNTIGNTVYFRGLIEISNICKKDCYYCGIRASNNICRYELSKEEVLESVKFAIDSGYGSIVIQGGERADNNFIEKISSLIRDIKKLDTPPLGITLSLGEQSLEVYKEWYKAGAHRYLLRIESSNPQLYSRIHPSDHLFVDRIIALENLKKVGYQVGSGIMIGLPFQTIEDLANDLLFLKEIDIDMCGMGPYLLHRDTPMYEYSQDLLSPEKRLELTLKMIAILRLIMPDINIAATTALQVIDKMAREKAILAGANIIMPNMTDGGVRKNYQIYENKPNINEDAIISCTKLEENLKTLGIPFAKGEWGDSLHFKNRRLL